MAFWAASKRFEQQKKGGFDSKMSDCLFFAPESL
jgi:hypothetical protein